jgi:predicted HAD superfamily Cof-like phosphohydrolase
MTLAQVKEFNETFGVAMSATPTTRVPTAGLRYELIREELEEFSEAMNALDIVEVADALGDIQYVVHGAVLVFGLEHQDLHVGVDLSAYSIFIEKDREMLLFHLHRAILHNDTRKLTRVLDKLAVEVKKVAKELSIDLEAVVDAIHESNMSKLGEDGKPIYRENDGKVMKGPNYKTPTDDIRKLVFGDNYAPTGE